MTSNAADLHKLVDIDSVDSVLGEVNEVIGMILPGSGMRVFEQCFRDVVRLYNGNFEGYRPCSTQYHDLRHTLDVLLATVRMLHACVLNGYTISPAGMETVMIAALMHDTGYIQEAGDDGTGGKYTLVHVERSAAFFDTYGKTLGLSDDTISRGCCMIAATSLAIPLDSIQYPDGETELLSKLLASADLLGQLADRLYLEKLLFLYSEFEEADVPGISHEFDLLRQTRDFYVMVRRRLDHDLGALGTILHHHFRVRWQIDRNLYEESINSNLQYLEVIISGQKNDYRSRLKRGGIVERLVRSDAGDSDYRHPPDKPGDAIT